MTAHKQTPQERYHAKYKRQFKIDCFTSTEKDIIDRLESVPNKAGYIKQLIRSDIKKNNAKEREPQMKANVFEVKKYSIEIKSKDKKSIKTGCCLEDSDPEVVATFNTLEEARQELKSDKYQPTCIYMPATVPYYLVTEYAIDCYEADEDGDFADGSDYDFVYKYEFDADADKIQMLH